MTFSHTRWFRKKVHMFLCVKMLVIFFCTIQFLEWDLVFFSCNFSEKIKNIYFCIKEFGASAKSMQSRTITGDTLVRVTIVTRTPRWWTAPTLSFNVHRFWRVREWYKYNNCMEWTRTLLCLHYWSRENDKTLKSAEKRLWNLLKRCG